MRWQRRPHVGMARRRGVAPALLAVEHAVVAPAPVQLVPLLVPARVAVVCGAAASAASAASAALASAGHLWVLPAGRWAPGALRKCWAAALEHQQQTAAAHLQAACPGTGCCRAPPGGQTRCWRRTNLFKQVRKSQHTRFSGACCRSTASPAAAILATRAAGVRQTSHGSGSSRDGSRQDSRQDSRQHGGALCSQVP